MSPALKIGVQPLFAKRGPSFKGFSLLQFPDVTIREVSLSGEMSLLGTIHMIKLEAILSQHSPGRGVACAVGGYFL